MYDCRLDEFPLDVMRRFSAVNIASADEGFVRIMERS